MLKERASQVVLVVKNPPAKQEMPVQPLSGEEPLDREMATHSGILAWKILWTQEPGGLQRLHMQHVIINCLFWVWGLFWDVGLRG